MIYFHIKSVAPLMFNTCIFGIFCNCTLHNFILRWGLLYRLCSANAQSLIYIYIYIISGYAYKRLLIILFNYAYIRLLIIRHANVKENQTQEQLFINKDINKGKSGEKNKGDIVIKAHYR